MKHNEREIEELPNSIRRRNIRIIGILKGEENEQGLESIFRLIVDVNLPNLRNGLELGIQEVSRTPNYLNPKRPSPRHIVLKLSKLNDKNTILQAAMEKKTVTYKRTPTRISSAQTLQAKRVAKNTQTIK